MKSVSYDDKGWHLDTVENVYMWKEAMKGNQLNDEHTVMFNKIFSTVLKREGQLTELSLYKTRSMGNVTIVKCKQLVTNLHRCHRQPRKKNYFPQYSVSKEYLQQYHKV